MSDHAQCVVCDAAINPYGQDTRCERCSEPCTICGGDVSLCQHPLQERADLEPKQLPNGRWSVAA
jgi:hypothetical protein